MISDNRVVECLDMATEATESALSSARANLSRHGPARPLGLRPKISSEAPVLDPHRGRACRVPDLEPCPAAAVAVRHVAALRVKVQDRLYLRPTCLLA
jgi:hypothetical protein